MSQPIGPLDKPLDSNQLEDIGRNLQPNLRESKGNILGHIFRRIENSRIFNLIKEKIFKEPTLTSKYSFNELDPSKGALIRFGSHIKYFNDTHQKLGKAIGELTKQKARLESKKPDNEEQKIEKEEKIKEIDAEIEAHSNEITKLVEHYKAQSNVIQSLFDTATLKFPDSEVTTQIKEEHKQFVAIQKFAENLTENVSVKPLQAPVEEAEPQELPKQKKLVELDALDDLLASLPKKEEIKNEQILPEEVKLEEKKPEDDKKLPEEKLLEVEKKEIPSEIKPEEKKTEGFRAFDHYLKQTQDYAKERKKKIATDSAQENAKIEKKKEILSELKVNIIKEFSRLLREAAGSDAVENQPLIDVLETLTKPEIDFKHLRNLINIGEDYLSNIYKRNHSESVPPEFFVDLEEIKERLKTAGYE